MKIKLIFLTLVLLGGCKGGSDYVHHDNPPRIENLQQKRKILKDDLQVDILFVIDNSGSMQSIQDNIVANAALFMQEFTQNNVMDWRIGIVSTDRSQKPYLGFETTFDKTVNDPIRVFQDAVDDLGIKGSASEYVFYNVLRWMTNTDTRFENFFRTNAHLAVIMVTDEEEQSEGSFGSQYEPLTFLNSVKALKNPNRIVRFYGAFNFEDLDSCGYSIEPPYAGSPFESVILQTSGIHMSACTKDFGVRLAEIGEDIVNIGEPPKFTLDTRPKIGTIAVYYKGKNLPMGKEEDGGVWYYDKYFNTINFYNLDFAPNIFNSEIEIYYEIDDGVQREHGET